MTEERDHVARRSGNSAKTAKSGVRKKALGRSPLGRQFRAGMISLTLISFGMEILPFAIITNENVRPTQA